MITEDYVSLDVAKLLKEKGFKSDDCHTAYDENGQLFWYGDYSKDRKGAVDAPTLQMAMKWLRAAHKLFIDVTAAMNDYIENGEVKYSGPFYYWSIFSLEIAETLAYSPILDTYATYEQCCEDAVKYCLENLI